FQPPVAYATDANPASLAVADLNGDATLDLVVANQGSNNVSLLPGVGDGTFKQAVPFTAGGHPRPAGGGGFYVGEEPPLLAGVNNGTTNLALLLNQPNAEASSQTENQRYVTQVYVDLLERAVDPTGLAGWSAMLDQGVARSQVIQGIEASQEYETLQVQHIYHD